MADTLVEGVTLQNIPSGGSAATTVDWTLSGLSGPASWGLPGVNYPVSTNAQLYDAIGFGAVLANGSIAPNDLVTEAVDFLSTQGLDGNTMPMSLLVNRTTDGSETAAQISVVDTANAVLYTLTGRCPGTRANGANVTHSKNYASTTLRPAFDITITMPGGQPQTWVGIVAWKLTNNVAAFDAPTFIANAVAAINAGFGSQGPSAYFVATGGGVGVAQPKVDTPIGPVTVLGTDGADTLNTAGLVGVDTISTRSGLQAFAGTGVFQFAIAGMIDPTADAALASFAQREKSLALSAVPSGTATAAAIASIGVSSIFLAKCMDWLRVDSTGKLHCPIGTILGIIAQTPPWKSIANKPTQGLPNVLSTEKTGKSLSTPEKGQRQGAGLLYVTDDMPRKGKLKGLPHGRNTSGIQYQDDVAYTRLTNYLELRIPAVLGQLVGENQGPDPDDDLRRAAIGAVRSMLGTMKRSKQIALFDVTDDLTNNTPATIALAYNFLFVQAAYFTAVRDFFVGLQAGGNVIITSQPAT